VPAVYLALARQLHSNNPRFQPTPNTRAFWERRFAWLLFRLVGNLRARLTPLPLGGLSRVNLSVGRKRKVNRPISLLYLFSGFIVITTLAGCGQKQTDLPSTSAIDSTKVVPTMTSIPVLTPSEATTLARIDLSPELYLRQIKKNVFVVTHAFPWPANSLIVEMANSDLVLVGTPYTPAAMSEVLKWISGYYGQRKMIAINTGYHVDNLGGNSALINQGIPVYGSDLTAQLLKERGEQTRLVILGMLTGKANESYYQAHKEIPYVAPTKQFPIEQGLTLSLGDEQVIVYYPGPSQAPDKVVVYFPSQKVLFGGCMILGGDQIGNTSDADLKNWPVAVSKLKQFDADVVVPGHGDRLDTGLIEHTITLLTAKP
jgi:metallo-beta-lactamase class B